MASDIPIDTLTLPDGRTLAWTVYGGSLDRDSARPPAVALYFHGLPGSRVEGRFFPVAALQKHHARVVAIDRPGMGGSTYYATRRVLDWPADALAVADHLHVHQFYIIGASGGGPYTMACIREIPRVRADGTGRLRGVAAVCPMLPLTRGTAGMMPSFRAMLAMAAWLPLGWTAALMDRFVGAAAKDPDPAVLIRTVEEMFLARQPLEQEMFAKPAIRQLVLDSARESFRQAKAGNALDTALLSDWGFDIAGLDGTGVTLWHGRQDINVPFQMAEQAATLMPNIKTVFPEGETHVSLVYNYAEAILADLLADRDDAPPTE